MKILVCTDGSEQSLRAVRKTADIVSDYKNAQVTVLHVEESISHPYEIPSVEHSPEGHKRLEDEHKRVMAEAAKIFEEKNIKADVALRQGHPVSTILEMASKESFDLIVLGNRGLGGLKKLILGSVSNAVVQETDASVLIVK